MLKKIDLKEIINPLILLPLIVIITFLIGFRNLNLILFSFIFFFFISFINTSIQTTTKKIPKIHYIWFYEESFLSLLFLIPLFYLIKLKHPILLSFSILGFTDFMIQSYYNILPRKNNKQIVKLWKNKLIKSERTWFHPISMQRYIFKDFKTEIIEPNKINPTINFISLRKGIFISRINERIIKHQYKHKNSIAFQIFLNKKQKITQYNDNEIDNTEEHFKKLAKDRTLLSKLKKTDNKIFPNILTAYMWKGKLRIIFNKKFVLDNPKKVYSFLSKINQNPNKSKNK